MVPFQQQSKLPPPVINQPKPEKPLRYNLILYNLNSNLDQLL